MKKLKKALYWLVLDAGLLACTYYGILQGAVQARNILFFMIPIVAVLSTLGAFAGCSGKFKPELRDAARDRVIPAWLSVGVDLVVIGVLASAGHFGMAALMVWGLGMDAVTRSAVKEAVGGEP